MAETSITNAQLEMIPISAVHEQNGSRVLELMNRALQENGISRSRLCDETGIDNSHLTRVLSGENGANPPLSLLAAVLQLDRARILINGLCGMVKCEAVEKKPDLSAENRRLRDDLLAARAIINKALGTEG